MAEGVIDGIGFSFQEDLLSSSNNLPVFTEDRSNNFDGFGFMEFLKVFFLGDYRLIMSYMPSYNSFLDFPDEERETRTSVGDPIKNAMRIQTMRGMPILTAIPLVLTGCLLVMDIFLLIMPISHRILAQTFLGPYIEPYVANIDQEGGEIGSRHRRSTSSKEGKSKSGDRILASIESVTSAFHKYSVKNGWLKSNLEENGTLNEKRKGMNELPEYNVPAYVKFESIAFETIHSFSDILPQIGSCIGSVIGIFMRLGFWDSYGSPFGPIITCSSVVGRSISHLLAVLGRNEIIYPI